jgi:hypothetical protein
LVSKWRKDFSEDIFFEWHKFSRKKKTPNVKNVERKNIESAINAASVHPFILAM